MIDSSSKKFISENIGGFDSALKLAGDVSTRLYYRVLYGNRSAILCSDPAFKGRSTEEYPFIIVHDIFKSAKVNLPEIYATKSIDGLLLLEDLGDDMVESVIDKFSAHEILSLYKKIITELVKIQSIKNDGSLPFTISFDTDKLMFEFDFFIEHFLKGYLKINESQAGKSIHELRNEFMKIAQILVKPGFFVINHRDFHARNIILHKDNPYIIDFQDARLGLPQYDAVSLLRDSYVSLEQGIFNELKLYYMEASKSAGIHSMGPDEFNFYFDVMAFQRNVKALGTFGFMVSKKNDSRYERHIAPSIKYLPGYAERNEELEKAMGIISDLL